MTATPSNDKKIINALPLVEKVEFTQGVSAKSGNSYLVGAVYVKSPISDSPIRLSFEYIDPNTRALLEMAFDKFSAEEQQDFQKGVQS